MSKAPLLTKEQLRELSKPSFLRWFLMVGINWSLCGLMIYTFSQHPSWWLGFLTVIVVGSRQHALALYSHEVAHRIIGLPRLATDIIGNLLCFYPINLSLSGYRHFHLEHHKHLGHQSDDPEQPMKLNSTPSWTAAMTPVEFWMCYFKRLFFLNFKDTIAFKKATRCRSRNEKIFYYVFWAAVYAVVWKTSAWMYLGFWLLSNLTAAPATSKIRALTEHPYRTETLRLKVPFLLQFFFPGNTSHHFEHHSYQSIPFFNLPKAREMIGPEPKIHSMSEFYSLLGDVESNVTKKYSDEKSKAS